jgi:hypothetical protein
MKPDQVIVRGDEVCAYGASPIKRHRRTAAEMEAIRLEIERVLALESPCTVRQVYYQLVTRGAIDKTEAQYDTVGRLLVEMRREGRVSYGAIADNTRAMRKPRTWESLDEALARTQETYRRALWSDQPAYVEVWLEKDALAGVLIDVTREWDVPLMVTKGFASLSFLHSAAETIAYCGKPAYLYYFGDHDPSGVVIDRKIGQTLRELAPDAEIHLERVAVRPEQIEEWSLPTRPTKTSDSRSRNFVGESVEVDAIPPTKLRALANDCIVQHIDNDAYYATLRTEKAERDTLAQLIKGGLS